MGDAITDLGMIGSGSSQVVALNCQSKMGIVTIIGISLEWQPGRHYPQGSMEIANAESHSYG